MPCHALPCLALLQCLTNLLKPTPVGAGNSKCSQVLLTGQHIGLYPMGKSVPYMQPWKEEK
jgi:hypothetical protein